MLSDQSVAFFVSNSSLNTEVKQTRATALSSLSSELRQISTQREVNPKMLVCCLLWDLTHKRLFNSPELLLIIKLTEH